jgi:hypothetical protein
MCEQIAQGNFLASFRQYIEKLAKMDSPSPVHHSLFSLALSGTEKCLPNGVTDDLGHVFSR